MLLCFVFLFWFSCKCIYCGVSIWIASTSWCNEMKFKWVPTNICLYKEVDKKYASCNLKTTYLLDYALIGVCHCMTLTYILQLNDCHFFMSTLVFGCFRFTVWPTVIKPGIHFILNAQHSESNFQQMTHWNIFLFSHCRKQDLTFHANCLQWRHNLYEMSNMFFGEMRKISICRLLNLPREWSRLKGL